MYDYTTQNLSFSKTKYFLVNDADIIFGNNICELHDIIDTIDQQKSKNIIRIPLYESEKSVFYYGENKKYWDKFYPYSYVWIFNKEEVEKFSLINSGTIPVCIKDL